MTQIELENIILILCIFLRVNTSQSHYRGVCSGEFEDFEENEIVFCACQSEGNNATNDTWSECGRDLDLYQCTDTRLELDRIDSGEENIVTYIFSPFSCFCCFDGYLSRLFFFQSNYTHFSVSMCWSFSWTI